MSLDVILAIVAFVLTLMVFSYLIGDNPLFRLATYLFVGVTAGYVFFTVGIQVLWYRLVLPLISGGTEQRILAAVALLLSLLLFAKASPRLARLGSLPMAYLVGTGAAVAIGGAVLGTIFPQVQGTINLFGLERPGLDPSVQFLDALFVALGTAATLVYFQFTGKARPGQPTRRSPIVESIASVGQVFIGITLGALFAGVFSASLTAMIERVSSVVNLILVLMG